MPDFALPANDGRPLAYASLGTLQGGRVGLFRAIASGAARRDLRLVIAHGGRMREGDVRTLPGSPSVHAFVPQDTVLKETSVAILNGGLNTVMDALAHGVPILALPIAFEQGAIAARLARAGTGLVAGRRFLGGGRVARRLGRILDDPGYRENALRLSREIASAGGVTRAADIVDTLLETGRPVVHDAGCA